MTLKSPCNPHELAVMLITPLWLISSSNSVKFVDDAHRELFNISEWMRVNKLSPNPKKTVFIGHPLKTRTLDLPDVLTLDGSDIKNVG